MRKVKIIPAATEPGTTKWWARKWLKVGRPETKAGIQKDWRPPTVLLSCLLFLASSPILASAAPPPAANDLLQAALADPQVAYQGRVMLTQWYGKRTRAEEARVFFNPPNLYRWEFLSPDGQISRVIISDGSDEFVWLPKEHKVLKGSAAKSSPKLMVPELERELLLKNYQAKLLGPDQVAGRTTWVLELAPLIPGKPHQKFWIDQETAVILETKRLGPTGARAGLSRFARFKPQKDMSKDLFQVKADSMTQVIDHGLDPDFFSIKELRHRTGKSLNLPEQLPGNFTFESGDAYQLNEASVRHIRYTDGLAVLSLFETSRPVGPMLDKTREFSPLATPEQFSSGKVLQWKKGHQYFTLVGDVSDELLEQIASELKAM